MSMYQEPIPQPRDEREWQSSSYANQTASSDYDSGYRGNQQYTDQLADAIAQRLRSDLRSNSRQDTSLSGQRLALAIVSIVMLVPLTAIILGTAAMTGWFAPFLLGFLFVVILAINLIFNYRN
ncbi:MAG TPA: hypothetical protein VED37_13975 [Ktedonobacteraceae bacterium]|nr:hypothetical protein [Ktedonobacteraceae bacterium]